MIDEARFQRLEDKVDNVKESVHDMSKELSEQRHDMKIHINKIEEHITGDNKIIKELQPILNKLPDIVQMAEQYHANNIIKTRMKTIRLKAVKFVGFTSIIVGILTGLHKMGLFNL
jgi:hypothetical protein